MRNALLIEQMEEKLSINEILDIMFLIGWEPYYCSSIEDLIEELALTPVEAAQKVFFGNVKNWNDDYFRLDGYENIISLSEDEMHREVQRDAQDAIEEYIRLVESGEVEDMYMN